MHFTKIRAGGWVSLSTLGAAEMQTFDDNLYAAINGDDGGTWAPSSRIIIGGEGLEMRALLAIGNGGGSDGAIEVRDGSGASWLSGSALLQYAGAEWVMSGTTAFGGAGTDADGGAGHHVVSGGKLYVDDGATVKVRVGGTLQVVGTFIASSGSEVRLYDETRQYSGEFIVNDGVPMTLHGDVTIKSDGTLVTEAGSTTTLGGTHNVTGTLQTSGSSAEIIVKAGGSFTSEALATVSHAGDVDVGGTLTVSGEYVQTGTLTKSGTGAMTGLRVGSTANADGTYGAEKDIWLIGAFNEHTYTLRSSTSPVPVEGTTLRFVCTAQLIGNMHFAREDTSVVANLPLGTDYVWVEFVYHSGSWYFAGGSGVN